MVYVGMGLIVRVCFKRRIVPRDMVLRPTFRVLCCLADRLVPS